jgi:DNA (cytosine-5-)-methyltransferase
VTKSARNKTLILTEDETQTYFERCVSSAYIAKTGDVSDKTVCGDAFEAAASMPEGFVDLMIVDPPYNMNKQFAGLEFKLMSADDYREFTERWVEAFYPTLKKNASVYVCCDWKSGMVIAPVLERFFKVRNRITWQREKGRGAAGNWKNGMEDIWYCTVSGNYKFNLGAVKQRKRVIAPYRENGAPKDWFESGGVKYRDTCPSNFWDDITVPYWSMRENTPHPTQKPEKLLAKLILASSDKGDVVLDPFGGSGSTAVAAKKLGRKYLTVEVNPDYCALCECRLERADSDKSVQGMEDGIFYARGEK